MVYLYTNEVDLIREQGGIIDWITAAWTSWNTAPGLNRYAEWAKREVREATEMRRRWMKPTLLATYGVLATRPRLAEWGYKHATGGIPREYPAGSGVLHVLAKVGERETEPATANVIYRGLIEAEQRVRAIRLARDLSRRGLNVLAIYADSVFVESTGPLPFLPPGWRVQNELDRLRFWNPTSFTSAQVDKLPGVPREVADRVAVLRRIGNPPTRAVRRPKG